MRLRTVFTLFILLLFSCGEEKKSSTEEWKYTAVATIQFGNSSSNPTNKILDQGLNLPISEASDLLEEITVLLNSQTLAKRALSAYCAYRECTSDSTEFYKQVAAQTEQVSFKIMEEKQNIKIEFNTNKDGKFAVDYLNALVGSLINMHVERMIHSSNKTLQYIDEQLEEVYKKLQASEDTLQLFKRNHGISETTMDVESLAALEKDLVRIKLEHEQLSKIENELSKDRAPESEELAELISLLTGTNFEKILSPHIENLYDLILKRDEILHEATQDNIKVKQLEYEISKQKEMTLRMVSELKNRLRKKEQFIASRIKGVNEKVETSPEVEQQLAQLQRKYDMNEKFYSMLMNKKTEYSISKAGMVPNIRIIDTARLKK